MSLTYQDLVDAVRKADTEIESRANQPRTVFIAPQSLLDAWKEEFGSYPEGIEPSDPMQLFRFELGRIDARIPPTTPANPPHKRSRISAAALNHLMRK